MCGMTTTVRATAPATISDATAPLTSSEIAARQAPPSPRAPAELASLHAERNGRTDVHTRSGAAVSDSSSGALAGPQGSVTDAVDGAGVPAPCGAVLPQAPLAPGELASSSERTLSRTLAPVAPLDRTRAEATPGTTPRTALAALHRHPTPAPVPVPRSQSAAHSEGCPPPVPTESLCALPLFKSPDPAHGMRNYAIPLYLPSALVVPPPAPPSRSRSPTISTSPSRELSEVGADTAQTSPQPDACELPLQQRVLAAHGTDVAALVEEFRELVDSVAPQCRERVARWVPATADDLAATMVAAARGYRAAKATGKEPQAGAPPAVMLFDVRRRCLPHDCELAGT